MMVDNAPKLVLLNTETPGREFPLTRNVTIIGRSPDCDIVVESASVSRSHARIERFGDHFVVSDLGSRNGIMLDGQPAPEGQLVEGGMLAVGEVVFRAENIPEIRHEAPAPPAPPRARPRQGDEPTPAPYLPAAGAEPPLPEAPAEQAVAEPEPPPLRPAVSAQQQALAEHAERFGPAFIVALAVLASALVLAFAWRAMTREEDALVMELQPVKVRVNERYWTIVEGLARVGGALRPVAADIREGSIKIRPEGVAEVERFGRGEIVVTGLAHGDAVATMETPRGNLVRVRIMVRGRLATPEDAIRRFRGSDAERLQVVENLIRAGDILMNRGQPYRAMKAYERAVHYARPSPATRHLHVEARDKMSRAQRDVDRRYQELADAANLSRSRQNFQGAMDIVNEIISLIPDENDPRNQRARNALIRWELESPAVRRRR